MEASDNGCKLVMPVFSSDELECIIRPVSMDAAVHQFRYNVVDTRAPKRTVKTSPLGMVVHTKNLDGLCCERQDSWFFIFQEVTLVNKPQRMSHSRKSAKIVLDDVTRALGLFLVAEVGSQKDDLVLQRRETACTGVYSSFVSWCNLTSLSLSDIDAL